MKILITLALIAFIGISVVVAISVGRISENYEKERYQDVLILCNRQVDSDLKKLQAEFDKVLQGYCNLYGMCTREELTFKLQKDTGTTVDIFSIDHRNNRVRNCISKNYVKNE